MSKLKWHSPGVAERVEKLEKEQTEGRAELQQVIRRLVEIEEALKEAYNATQAPAAV